MFTGNCCRREWGDDQKARIIAESCEPWRDGVLCGTPACILERGGHINSAGGYLRDLTRRSEKGEFAIGPMLMALLKANGQGRFKVG